MTKKQETLDTRLPVLARETAEKCYVVAETIPSLTIIILAALQQVAAEVRALDAPYLKHKRNCESRTHLTGTPDLGGELRHIRPADCTCGLAALRDPQELT